MAHNIHSLLYVAADYGFVEIAKTLIRANANVNQQCDNGYTPLIVAASKGHFEIVQLLVQQPEIVVDLFDDLRQTALHHANVNGHQRIVDLLSKESENVVNVAHSSLSRKEILKNFKESVLSNDIDSVQLLLDQEPWIVNRLFQVQFDRFDSALFYAASRNCTALASVLIDHKANVNQQCQNGVAPLGIAAGNGFEAMVCLLLRQSDIVVDLAHVYGWTALHQAAAKGHVGVMQQLLDVKANLHAVAGEGQTSLTMAASNGHRTAVQLLLRENADVNHQNRRGFCSLYWAAKHSHDEVVADLLKANASVDLCTYANDTALFAAVNSGSLAITKQLLAAGADAQHRNAKNKSALHVACEYGHVPVVIELLKAGVDADALHDGGFTPLLLAARAGHHPCIVPLLEAKADINRADNSGKSALFHAIYRGHFLTTQFLLHHGADARKKKGQKSARQAALTSDVLIQKRFACSLCGYTGLCCSDCRQTYCSIECDKFWGIPTSIDCRLHRKVAHNAVLEWALAMSSLKLPPYVVEHIFNSPKCNVPFVGDYQAKKAAEFLWIPETSSETLDVNYIHVIIEERTHQENIQLFIAIRKAMQKE